MSPALLALALTSTRAIYSVEEPYDDTAERETELQGYREEVWARWAEQRGVNFTMRAGVRVDVHLVHGSVEIGFGFLERMTSKLALQGNLTLGSGLFDLDGLVPFLDVIADLTLRIGERRFFWGFGPMARVFQVFAPDQGFGAGGGAVVELGVLGGQQREYEMVLRLNGGAFRLDGSLEAWAATTYAVGYHF